jgi:uncharacterized protein with HEPN domain
MRRDLAYLQDIIEASLARQFTVIGEAASRVAGDLRGRHSSIPWAQARGLRNIVVHHYFGIAWDGVWQTATVDIPALRDQVAEVIRIELPDSNATLES